MKRYRLPTSLLFVLMCASGVAAFSLVSVNQEIQIGREAQSQVRAQVPPIRDSVVASYVQSIGRRLATSAPGARYPYSFSVADYREVNAFALPGGPVWVHRGAIDIARNESELAGVLAHEIAHIAQRHAAEQISKATVANGLLGLLGAVLDNGSRAETVARIGAGLGAQAMFLKFSRNDEREADLVGAQIMRRAGWDPRGLVGFLDTLAAQQRRSPSSVETFLSTHPAPAARAGELRGLAGGGRRDSAQFQQIQRRIDRLPPASSMRRR
jgi:beta-barrel assembly-enhancing protease